MSIEQTTHSPSPQIEAEVGRKEQTMDLRDKEIGTVRGVCFHPSLNKPAIELAAAGM